MKKITLSLLLLAVSVFGFDYDEVLLKTQATIFPKIVLLDKKLDNKLIDEKIVFTIIYPDKDYQTALNVKSFIDTTYNGLFEDYKYEIILMRCSDLSEQTQTTALYILNSCVDVQKIANIAKEKGVISFSYDVNNLQKGLLFSLNIERTTVFYLNRDKVYSDNVDFIDPLLQMVRFIDKSL